MSVRKDKTTISRPLTRRQVSRWQRERRTQRIVFILLGLAIAVIVAIPAFGYYQLISPYRQPIVRVNNKVYSVGDYMKWLRKMAYESTAMGQQMDLSVLPIELLITMQNNELISQAAPRYGITATPADVEQELRNQILGETTEQTDPERLEREFQEKYRQYLNSVKISDKDFRELVRIELLRRQIREQLSTKVPTVAPQVHLHQILVETEENAIEIKGRLEKGEHFDTLATELSMHWSAQDGGDLGWAPKQIYPSFDEIAFSMEIGKFSDPIPTADGYSIIMVSEKAEARKIDDDDREMLKDLALSEWLKEERDANKVELFFDSDRYAWAVDELRELTRTRPKEQK